MKYRYEVFLLFVFGACITNGAVEHFVYNEHAAMSWLGGAVVMLFFFVISIAACRDSKKEVPTMPNAEPERRGGSNGPSEATLNCLLGRKLNADGTHHKDCCCPDCGCSNY